MKIHTHIEEAIRLLNEALLIDADIRCQRTVGSHAQRALRRKLAAAEDAIITATNESNALLSLGKQMQGIVVGESWQNEVAS